MDWKIFFQTFAAIFFAELGDKTQMVVLLQASESKRWLVVSLAAVAGFALATLLAALLGQVVGKSLPEKPLKIVAGALFIVLGVWVVLAALYGAPEA